MRSDTRKLLFSSAIIGVALLGTLAFGAMIKMFAS